MSGIDTALWDAFGRTLGVPIYEMMGGSVRESIEAYASTGYVTKTGGTAQFRRELESAVNDGFNAAKIRIGLSPQDDYDRVKVAREILGPDRKLMVDYNTSGTLASIRRSLDLISEFNPYWIEEPLPPEDVKGWEALRSGGHNLTGGESLCTRFAFKDLVVNKRMDIIQPDLAACGGLTEGQAILTMANTWHVGISPHCWGTGILQAATLQLLAAASPASGHHHIFEFDRGDNPQREGVLAEPIRQLNGVVSIPTAPGLGVEVDEGWVSRNAVEGLGVKASL
jgi:D-galactarolactone cycloisomerase